MPAKRAPTPSRVSRKTGISFRVDPDVWRLLESMPGFPSAHKAAEALLMQQIAGQATAERVEAVEREVRLLRAPMEAILLNIAGIQAAVAGDDTSKREARVKK